MMIGERMGFSMKMLVPIALMLFCLCPLAHSLEVSHDGRALLIDGQRRIIISGSIHYPRSTPQMWPDLIKKAKDGGLDAIETYVFWNAHEPSRRQYDFTGNLDLVRFIKEIQNAGLYAILRIGPYVCAEWNYGGLPVWLHQVKGMELRTDNQLFKDEMQNFTTLIVNMMKQENLLAPQGGPIILTQIENEYHDAQEGYGDAGKRYVQWCANMAESLDVGVPWIMCKQEDAPPSMINTCNGFYCDQFEPNKKTSPKMWTENWTGWFKTWQRADPHRLPEELAYSVARFFQLRGTFQNYYMYHGGTNFGRTSGGPYITTSYDYDAPLDEYGNTRQPKWGHLKELHSAIKMMETALIQGEFSSTNITTNVWLTKYSTNGTSPGCFISNKRETEDVHVEYQGIKYFLPAKSVSILPDCKKEAHNTAKVNSQTTIMEMQPNGAEKEPAALKWSWRHETMRDSLLGLKGSATANALIEQKLVSGDASDYLWYMTSVDIEKEGTMTLYVNTTGPVLHAFVNGHLVGSQYADAIKDNGYNFTFEANVTTMAGQNHIALLSATVGLPNYGAHYDLKPQGIVGGPVKLIGENVTIDLSSNLWSYKIGLDGEDNKIYLDPHGHRWFNGGIPIKKPFTWYKTTFKAPLGLEPVVVDLKGMGKGAAWVNGQSIGRYWTNYIVPGKDCNNKCDYRQGYDEANCRTGCGEPGQRWYHIPRSFLKAGELNKLVLFEEAGGDPNAVNFDTVVERLVCANVLEGSTLTLSCEGGRKLSSIEFASFGDPKGKPGSFQKGSCDAKEALPSVTKACLGKKSCSIEVSEDALGTCDCDHIPNRRLAVEAVCV